MTTHYWYFAPKDRRLRYDDGRLIEVGTTHTVEPPIKLCQHGLHASRRAIDALRYAPSPIVCRVTLGGDILHGDDKSCATERTYLSIVDAEDVLRSFARRCALDVIDPWDAPDVVREYLETGHGRLRAAAWDAAGDAAWVSAGDAVRVAVWAAAGAAAGDAAWVSAGGAAWVAAWDAAWAAARDAAWAAAWAADGAAARDEKIEQYNEWIENMLIDTEGDHQ